VLKTSALILSIWIWLYLMNVGILRVSASFGVVSGIYFTLDLGLDELGFLRVGDEETGGFVLTVFERGFVVGVVIVGYCITS
jgi:hypothetical protein